MVKTISFLKGATLGALAMFWLDPLGGRRRRARAKARAVRAMHQAEGMALTTGHDLRNRTRGTIARFRGSTRRPVDDDIVVERVRATLGHVCTHPRAIEVVVDEGEVSLSGAVTHDEAGPVLDAIRRVPAVRAVADHLQRREPKN
jgi:hyperosmotically inducible periplasmic protein